MSYTTLFKVPERGEIEEYAEFENSWLGAYTVWTEMAKRYLDWDVLPMSREGDMKPLWDLTKADRVLLNDRIVLATTFDQVMVRRENLAVVVAAMADFAQRHKPGHLPQQAEALRVLAADESCYAVCWNQTGVNGDAWREPSGEMDEYGDDEVYRMYDLAKDTNHWFLFDDVPLPETIPD